MSTHLVKTKHIAGMSFSAAVNEHEVPMDSPEDGKPGNGPSPKRLMLAALAGCTGVDIVSVLHKMKVDFKDLEIQVEAALTEEHPKIYKDVKITYSIRIAKADHDKMVKAVKLSMEKYCGVSAMFRAFSKLDFEIVYKDL